MSNLPLAVFLSLAPVQKFLTEQIEGESFQGYFADLCTLIEILECYSYSLHTLYLREAVSTTVRDITTAFTSDASISVIQTEILFGIVGKCNQLIEGLSNERP